MTIKITSLFATVTIAGILSMAPFMVNPNYAFAGVVICDEVLIGKQTLQRMFDDTNDCIQVDDKFFINFRPNPGGIGDVTFSDGSTLPFNAADIDVEGTTVGDEKGLMFTSSSILTFFPGIVAPSPVAIGLGFNYDVISTGTAIVDNTLTLDTFFVSDFNPSAFTGVVVQEQVHSDVLQQQVIAFKEVFADATPSSDLLDHKEFAPVSFVSVNVDIGARVNTQSSQNSASIEKFTQTFSQESEEPPKEPPVGGEFLPIDTTALLVAGAQTNALWILSTLAVIGSIAFGALYLTTRRA